MRGVFSAPQTMLGRFKLLFHAFFIARGPIIHMFAFRASQFDKMILRHGKESILCAYKKIKRLLSGIPAY